MSEYYGCIRCGVDELHHDGLCESHWRQEKILSGATREISHSNTIDLLEMVGLTFDTYWEEDRWVVEIFDEDYAELFENSTRIIALNSGKPVHESQVAAAFIFAINLGELTMEDLEEEIAPEILDTVEGMLEIFSAAYEEWEI